MSPLALALLLACAAAACCAGEPPARPNFLIFYADDAGYGDFGFNGHPTILTPNIDRLAAGGKRFTQMYTGARMARRAMTPCLRLVAD